jgi:hypothetical protein
MVKKEWWMTPEIERALDKAIRKLTILVARGENCEITFKIEKGKIVGSDYKAK